MNPGETEAFGGVSPDGEFLSFESDRGGRDQVFWVDSKAIEAIRSGTR